jgi:hypothetical protein
MTASTAAKAVATSSSEARAVATAGEASTVGAGAAIKT